LKNVVILLQVTIDNVGDFFEDTNLDRSNCRGTSTRLTDENVLLGSVGCCITYASVCLCAVRTDWAAWARLCQAKILLSCKCQPCYLRVS